MLEDQAHSQTRPPRIARERSWAGGSRLRGLTRGGTEGNERLTVLTGLLVIVVTAAVGVTIVKIGQLLWLHMFLGLLLIGPVALKLASTGYRFVRYYSENPRYHAKGPPVPALRILAPVVVLLTVIMFASGIVLLFIGPGSGSRSTLVLVHKVSFIAWIALTAVHVLGHLPEIVRLRRVSPESRRQLISASGPGQRQAAVAEPGATERLPGGGGRWLSLGGAMVIGLVLAILLIPDFATWTGAAGQVLIHHHHHHFHQ
jgi:hypothetical protein